MKIKSTKKCKCATAKVAAAVETPVEAPKPVVRKCGRPKKPGTEVTFTFHAEKGKSVYLAGDFNAWDPTAKKLAFKGGVYTTTVKILPGDHQYKFVVDGTWCADPENVNAVANDQGTFNSVITVK